MTRMDIGPLRTRTRFLLAPMAGYSNSSMRRLCVEHGAERLRQLVGWADAPEMDEVVGGLFPDHVIVQGDDVEIGSP